MKKCSRCKLELSLNLFSKCSSRSDGLQHRCVTCNGIYYQLNKEKIKKRNEENKKQISSYQAEYYKKNIAKKLIYEKKYRESNLEKISIKMKKWRKENPEKSSGYRHNRRVHMLENNSYYISKKEIKNIYSSPCLYCSSTEQIEIEHVVPISRGGAHSIGNITSACRKCNSSKKDRLIVEWKKSIRLKNIPSA